MKKDLHKTEKKIIEIYQCSLRKESSPQVERAKNVVKCVLQTFEMVDVFMNESHKKIVKQIYFSKANIGKVGVRVITQRIYVPERTLYKYRVKYCAMIEAIFARMGAGKDNSSG